MTPIDADDDDDRDPPLIALGLLALLFLANGACLFSLATALSRPEGFGAAVFWGMGIGGINFYLQQHCWRRLRRDGGPALPRLLIAPAGLTLLVMMFAAAA